MATDYNQLIYSGATATPYTDIYNAYKKSAEATKATEIARQNALRDKDLTASNAQYNNSARQNYINYMQGKKSALSDLSAQGIRGGASESSLIRLGTNYGSNVAENEAARNSALDAIRNQYAQSIADYTRAWQDDLNAKQAAYAEKQSEWERNQIAKNLEYFSSAIKGQYNSKAGYENLIKQLQASKDPNKVAKIMLTRQAMNEWLKENSNTGGGGGGGGYGGGGGGGYGGGGGGGGGGDTPSGYTMTNDRPAGTTGRRTGTNRGNTGRPRNRNAKKQRRYSKYKYWG